MEPEVRRIGKYKSAGDQLLRKDMSAEQREQLTAILDDIYGEFVARVARRRGKTEEEVEELINRGVYDMKTLAAEGWVDGLKYEGDVEEMLKERTGGKPDQMRQVRMAWWGERVVSGGPDEAGEDGVVGGAGSAEPSIVTPSGNGVGWNRGERSRGVNEPPPPAQVGYKKYKKVSPTAFNLMKGRKAIGILRASGGITNGGASDSGITAKKIIKDLRRLKKDPSVAAIVLRIDSPGGDALASDLMWDEIRRVQKDKPIVSGSADS